MNWGVSKCCGSSYEDSFITDCCQAEIDSTFIICSFCKKEADCTGYICNECGNWFEEPEEELEHKARLKENAILDKWEVERDER